MSNPNPSFYIIAGEASGDRHAADLLHELKKNYPHSKFYGAGGMHLKAAGQEQLFDLAEHAVVGLTDVLANYGKFRSFFYRILKDLKEKQPDVLVFVDFPGFNLRLAAKAKSMLPQTKLVYYIAPQVWAWKAGRAAKMAKMLDLLLVIFPFEKDWFARHTPSLKTEWVGHPALDRWSKLESLPVERDSRKKIILMPGSRRKEITVHLPILLKSCQYLADSVLDLKFQLLVNDPTNRALVTEIIKHCKAESLQLDICEGYQLTYLRQADLAFVASGTATLECALANLPMLVLYKVNPITFFIGRRLVKLNSLSIVNLIAEKKIVPEFLQKNANPVSLAEAAKHILTNPSIVTKMKMDLRAVIDKLGQTGANHRAVDAIKGIL